WWGSSAPRWALHLLHSRGGRAGAAGRRWLRRPGCASCRDLHGRVSLSGGGFSQTTRRLSIPCAAQRLRWRSWRSRSPAPSARRSDVGRPDALARDALAALAAAPAAADALIVFFAGAGRESHPDKGPADDPWSNYTALSPPADAGGVAFEAACVIAEKEVRPF